MSLQLTRSDVLALLGLSWVFAAAFVFMKVLVDQVSPGEVVLGRLIFGAVVVGAFAAWRRVRPNLRPAFLGRVLVLASVEMLAPYLLIAWAEIRIPSGIAAVLISTMPLFTAVLAALVFTDERLQRRHFAGFALGIAGVALVSGASPDSLLGLDVLASLAVVGGAVCYACGTVYARVLLRHDDALSLTAHQLVIGAIAMLALLGLSGSAPTFALDAQGGGSLLGLGILSTGVGMLGAFWLVARAGSVNASLVTYLIPIAGLILGWLVLGEPVGTSALAGLVLITAGVTFVLNLRPPHRRLAGKVSRAGATASA